MVIDKSALQKILKAHRKWHRQYVKTDGNAYRHWNLKRGGMSKERKEKAKQDVLKYLIQNGPATVFDLLRNLPYTVINLTTVLKELRKNEGIQYVMISTFSAPEHIKRERTRLYFIKNR